MDPKLDAEYIFLMTGTLFKQQKSFLKNPYLNFTV